MLDTMASGGHSKGSDRPTSRPDFAISDVVDVTMLKALGESTVPPPSSVTDLEDGLVLPERIFFDRLDDRARRAELLGALLQAKGLSPEQGVRALRAALGAIAASAEEAHVHGLASLGRALETVIGQLGITQAPVPTRTLDVLVLDETEISRDLVALAVEAQGHHVRCARDYADFVRQLDERLPDLIVTEIELSKAQPRQFCEVLVDLLSTRPVPFVFFSSVAKMELEVLGRHAGARCTVHKDHGIAGLIAALAGVLHQPR
jgi:CheY-like chemotaxis protein